MKYQYLGKIVEVARFSSNQTAQLADGTWVPSAMLQPLSQKVNEAPTPLEAATKKRAGQSEAN